jgi:predicted DNA-binding protein
MKIRLTDEEQEGLEACASYLGISTQDAARQAIREYIERFNNRAPAETSFISRAKELVERDKEILDELAK